jgi:hypothetical protein
MTDVRDATHVRLKDGRILKIREKWGIDSEGHLAAPSKGGFGCICEGDVRVSMWDAQEYYEFREIPTGDGKLSELTRIAFTMGVKYAATWLAKNKSYMDAAYANEDIVTDGLAYLETSDINVKGFRA